MDSLSHLMLTPDSCRREDIATDLGLGLVADGGLRALTTQGMGARWGCSRQAVHQWFGSQEDLRRVVVRGFAARWRRWLSVRVRVEGLVGLLPDCEEVVGWSRVWLAVVEHGARDPEIAAMADALSCSEREEIGSCLGRDPDSDAVLVVQFLAQGLRVGLCAARPTMSVDRAQRLLAASG